MVYFLQAQCGGPIKIGYTEKNLASRISGVQVGSSEKLDLICAIPGNMALERRLHNTFDSIRLHGEWFYPAKHLTDYIDYLYEKRIAITEPSCKQP